MRSRDYLEGYNDCLMKLQSALYDIQMIQPYDMIDPNDRGDVDNVLSEAEGKDNKKFALQDVVLYNDHEWNTQRAGMVMSSPEDIHVMLVILTEKGTVVAEYPKEVVKIGHVYAISRGTTLVDAIKEVKMHYTEANKK